MTSRDEPIRVGVLGARGRVGTEVCRAVDAADDDVFEICLVGAGWCGCEGACVVCRYDSMNRSLATS